MGSLRMAATLVPLGPAAAVVLGEDQVAVLGEGAKRRRVDETLRMLREGRKPN